MTSAAEDVLEFLAEQSRTDIRWGRPYAVSISVHAVLLILALALGRLAQLPLNEPVHVLEVHVVALEDLSLKGHGQDFDKGPLPEQTPSAEPLQARDPVLPGHIGKRSRGIARPVVRSAPPRLAAAGPIFGGGSGAGLAEAGVGREKIYTEVSAAKRWLARAPKRSDEGKGLVGPVGGAVDLNARRGSGAAADRPGGQFLTGGGGSEDGGTALSRRGEPIVEHLAGSYDDTASRTRGKIVPPSETPSDDEFFSIRGPLSHRKISIRLPSYPRWAEEQGVEAQIAVRLTVSADGRVLPNLRVEQTSGFPEFDKIALDALASAKFSPLTGPDHFKEEWGVATFNFRLKKIAKAGGAL